MLEPDNNAKWPKVCEEVAIKYLTKHGSSILSYAGRVVQHDHKISFMGAGLEI